MKFRLFLFSVALLGIGYIAGHGGVAGRPQVSRTALPPGNGVHPSGMVLVPASTLAPLPEGLGPEENRDIEVFRRATASVVYITSLALARDWFSLDVLQIPQGSGSGIIWDDKGHIVTNFHVIEEGSKFSVTLGDQSEWDAEVVGVAPEKDIAVLKIDAPASKLVPITPGTSGDLAVGQKVLAVGNPFGLDHTLTTGVVSALGREIQSPNGRTIRDVIQTDAAINPGNSGGPLLNSSGRLIGINAAILSRTGAYAGIGFAVPVDIVRRLVPQLIQHGRSILPGIGATFLPDAYSRRLGIPGVIVRDVAQGGAADQAGLRGISATRRRISVGDVVVAVNGHKVDTVDDLLYAFETAGVGQTVTLTVIRNQERRDVRVRLQSDEGSAT